MATKNLYKYDLNLHPHQLATTLIEQDNNDLNVIVQHDEKGNSASKKEITRITKNRRTKELEIKVKSQSKERQLLANGLKDKSPYFFLMEVMEKEAGYLKTEIYLKEREHILGTSDLQNQFFKTPSVLSSEQQKMLSYYLPWKKEISEDLQLAESCFQSVIGFPVKITKRDSKVENLQGISVGKWVTDTLGVIGGSFRKNIPCLLIEIGEVPIDQLNHLIPGSTQRRFLKEVFIPEFLPEEMDWEIKILVEKKNQNFFTENPNGFSIVGTNSCVE